MIRCYTNPEKHLKTNKKDLAFTWLMTILSTYLYIIHVGYLRGTGLMGSCQ